MPKHDKKALGSAFTPEVSADMIGRLLSSFAPPDATRVDPVFSREKADSLSSSLATIGSRTDLSANERSVLKGHLLDFDRNVRVRTQTSHPNLPFEGPMARAWYQIFDPDTQGSIGLRGDTLDRGRPNAFSLAHELGHDLQFRPGSSGASVNERMSQRQDEANVAAVLRLRQIGSPPFRGQRVPIGTTSFDAAVTDPRFEGIVSEFNKRTPPDIGVDADTTKSRTIRDFIDTLFD